MQRYLFNHLSNGEFVILMISSVLLIEFTMSVIARKFFSSFMSYENNRFIGYFIGAASANFGFILGFTIITLWRELYELKSFVTQEAEYLSLVVYNASAFPHAFQADLMNGVEQYVKIIIQDEWPLMRLGKVSEKSVPTFSHLFHVIQSYSPETKVESTFYNQLVTNLNKVIELRRKRMEFLETSLSDVFRFMFLFGLLVILFLISLLASESNKLKVLTTTLLCSMLALNLSVALLLDYPFTGLLNGEEDLFSVSALPFKRGILEQFDPDRKKEHTERIIAK
jgi:hypothetical protein